MHPAPPCRKASPWCRVMPRCAVPWHEDLARLAGARQDALETALARGEDPLAALCGAGGLAGWALPAAAQLPAEAARA